MYLPDETRGEANIQNGLRLSVDLAGDSSDSDDRISRAKACPADRPCAHSLLRSRGFLGADPPNESRSSFSTRKISTSSRRVSGFGFRADYAAEMVPFDATVGEFRIHYAGFFDPGFGYGSGDINGTRAVLEVRSHEVPFIMEDGQVVASLVFEKLLERPRQLYGEGIGSSYQRQGLKLSKHFRSV